MTDTFYLIIITASVAAIVRWFMTIMTIRRFKDSCTITPSSAKTLEELELRHGRIVHGLIRQKVLVEHSSDRYYLSVSTVAKFKKNRLLWLIIIWLIILTVAVIIDFILKEYSAPWIT